MVWLVGRTYTTGTAQDYQAVHAMQDQYTVVPLAQFGKPRVAPPQSQPDPTVDMAIPPRDQIDKLDSAEFFKRLDGKVLNGRSRYVLHFAKGDIPPINPRGFWSMTMYDSEYFLVANSANRYSLSSRDKFTSNPDGSMDLYIQKQSPGAGKQANWLPAPDGDFILMLRLYWPKTEAISGAWVPPPTKRVE